LKEILLQKILPQPGFEPGISLPFRGGRLIQFDLGRMIQISIKFNHEYYS